MKPVIICVDDEPVVLRSLEIELSSTFGEKYFLEFAQGGEEALEIVDELLEEGTHITVIIADYAMPRMKGDRLLAQVHEKSPQTVKILLTGQANIQGVTNAINHANLYRYITKPWGAKDLALTLQEANKSYFKEQLLIEQNNDLKSLNENLENRVRERTKTIEEQNEELAISFEQLKNTQSQLIQSERMASLWQLTAGIAHELNNPLNFVYSGVEALSAGMSDFMEIIELYSKLSEAEGKERVAIKEEIEALKEEMEYDEAIEEISTLVKSIREGARRSADIIKGLRAFTGIHKEDTSFVDTNRSLDLTLVLLEYKINEQIKIHKNYGDVPVIECYAGHFQQVLLHVLTNAIQALSDKGKIYIRTSHFANDGKDFIQISIKDTGVGISSENQSKIFEPFFTTRVVGEGKGLGLSIAHGIIEMHNGKIEAKSNEGEGTEVIITLPTKVKKEN
jgi:signal transduction histidine kinase